MCDAQYLSAMKDIFFALLSTITDASSSINRNSGCGGGGEIMMI